MVMDIIEDLEVPTNYQTILTLIIRITLALSIPVGRPRVRPAVADNLMYVGLASLVPGTYVTYMYAYCPTLRTALGAVLFNLLATAVVPCVVAFCIDKLLVELLIPMLQEKFEQVAPEVWTWLPTAVVVLALITSQPKVDRGVVRVLRDHLG